MQSAGRLVGDVTGALSEIVEQHKQGLEGQWRRGGSVGTEELRVALRRYRTLFGRLLNA